MATQSPVHHLAPLVPDHDAQAPAPETGPPSVALVGPALVCYGLAARLAEVPVASSTAYASLEEIPGPPRRHDLVIFLPESSNLERRLPEFRRCAEQRPTIVAAPAGTTSDDLLRLLHAGVRVLIEAEADVATWVSALAAARSQACLITDAARRALLARAFPADFVEPEKMVSGVRRQQILRMLLQGRSRHEMARHLGISAKTVSGYLTSIRRDSSFRQHFSECTPVRARTLFPPSALPTV